MVEVNLVKCARDDAKDTNVRNGCGQFGKADEVHAALDDWMLDADIGGFR